MRKIISVTLALFMLFCQFPLDAFAQNSNTRFASFVRNPNKNTDPDDDFLNTNRIAAESTKVTAASDRKLDGYLKEKEIQQAITSLDDQHEAALKALSQGNAPVFFSKVNDFNKILVRSFDKDLDNKQFEVAYYKMALIAFQMKENIILQQDADLAFEKASILFTRTQKCAKGSAAPPELTLLPEILSFSADAFLQDNTYTKQNSSFKTDLYLNIIIGALSKDYGSEQCNTAARISSIKALLRLNEGKNKELFKQVALKDKNNPAVIKALLPAVAIEGDLKDLEEITDIIVSNGKTLRPWSYIADFKSGNYLGQAAAMDSLYALGKTAWPLMFKYATTNYNLAAYTYANINAAYTDLTEKSMNIVKENLSNIYCSSAIEGLFDLFDTQDKHMELKKKIAYAYGRGGAPVHIAASDEHYCKVIVPQGSDPRLVEKQLLNMFIVELATTIIGEAVISNAIRAVKATAQYQRAMKMLKTAKAKSLKLRTFYASGRKNATQSLRNTAGKTASEIFETQAHTQFVRAPRAAKSAATVKNAVPEKNLSIPVQKKPLKANIEQAEQIALDQTQKNVSVGKNVAEVSKEMFPDDLLKRDPLSKASRQAYNDIDKSIGALEEAHISFSFQKEDLLEYLQNNKDELAKIEQQILDLRNPKSEISLQHKKKIKKARQELAALDKQLKNPNLNNAQKNELLYDKSSTELQLDWDINKLTENLASAEKRKVQLLADISNQQNRIALFEQIPTIKTKQKEMVDNMLADKHYTAKQKENLAWYKKHVLDKDLSDSKAFTTTFQIDQRNIENIAQNKNFLFQATGAKSTGARLPTNQTLDNYVVVSLDKGTNGITPAEFKRFIKEVPDLGQNPVFEFDMHGGYKKNGQFVSLFAETNNRARSLESTRDLVSIVRDAVADRADEATIIFKQCHSGEAMNDLLKMPFSERKGINLITPTGPMQPNVAMNSASVLGPNDSIRESISIAGNLGVQYTKKGKIYSPLQEALKKSTTLKGNYKGVPATQIQQELAGLQKLFSSRDLDGKELAKIIDDLPPTIERCNKESCRAFITSKKAVTQSHIDATIAIPQHLRDFVLETFETMPKY